MERETRLQLKPHRGASEHIDGAWWPQSKCMVDELPGLLMSLSDRLGEVAMVGYHRNSWDETPPLVQVDGRTIELLGFTSHEPATVIAIGNDGRHVTLHVIPPEAGEQVARQALDEAQGSADAVIVPAGRSTLARSVADVADKLARHESRGGEQRATEIRQWCEEAAQQFVDAPVQTFIPVLVEHIVRNRMIESPPATIAPSATNSGPMSDG
jgi:uncharacterized protein DUF5994